ncbi:carbon-nitrogen hydrolase family protein [Pseudonocardia kujensis]|uniref:carbon-nitrogen hydrolase family protein n=1 Tax=Pseudonocardia kujensis TaxID=1128675 RepID=UPI001E598E3D|nr:carbon-nitrogen hydrolase family protein [Pseudonocardia kujensis]MCE0768600.1 carbon-nitrogen hydrolase family protein [Pseudonocardia kujensis]
MSKTQTAIRLGLAQTMTYFGTRERENLENAARLTREAAEAGVDLLVFAENYPGPFTADNRYEVEPRLSAAAREHGVALAFGTSLPAPGRPGVYNVATVVLDADGERRGEYRRTHPDGPYMYRATKEWNYDYEPADQFPVFEMPWGIMGVCICSEIHLPEISRILALKGAEVVVYPSGLLLHECGYTESWQTLAYARAIENQMYTATLVNVVDSSVAAPLSDDPESLLSAQTKGIGLIASPEGVLARSTETGILIADLDLEHIRELRRTDEKYVMPPPFETIPGHLKWRRPNLYGDLTDSPLWPVPRAGRAGAEDGRVTRSMG